MHFKYSNNTPHPNLLNHLNLIRRCYILATVVDSFEASFLKDNLLIQLIG